MRRPTVGFRNYDSLKQKLFPQGQGEGNSRNADLSEVRIDGSRARRTAGIGATVTHCAYKALLEEFAFSNFDIAFRSLLLTTRAYLVLCRHGFCPNV